VFRNCPPTSNAFQEERIPFGYAAAAYCGEVSSDLCAAKEQKDCLQIKEDRFVREERPKTAAHRVISTIATKVFVFVVHVAGNGFDIAAQASIRPARRKQ